MTTTDITGAILADIRDEIRGTNARLDHANARFDHTIARLDARLDTHDRILLRIADELGGVNGRLDRLHARVGQVEHEQRVTNARLETLIEVAGRFVDRGARIDEALADLRRRVELLERTSP